MDIEPHSFITAKDMKNDKRFDSLSVMTHSEKYNEWDFYSYSLID